MSFVGFFLLVSTEASEGVTDQVAVLVWTADTGSALTRVSTKHVVQYTRTTVKALYAVGNWARDAFLRRVSRRVRDWSRGRDSNSE